MNHRLSLLTRACQRHAACAVLAIVLGLALTSCDPPAYPAYADRTAVITEAHKISDDLEAYIKDWLDGKVPAALPDRLIPKGVDLTQFKNFRLQRLAELDPAQQWVVRPAFEAIDFNAATGYFPDKHVTYMIPGVFFAPFGSTVVIDGQFPHSRFFDVQVVPPFAPENYYYASGFGVGEVPIVDADMVPQPGSTNPFLPGADRTATKRDYQLRFTLATGDALALNQAMHPPYYRQSGNQRFGTGLVYQGAWGRPDSANGHARGVWNTSSLWVRYYAPDKASGPLGGVPLPRIHYELPDGRGYYLTCDFSAFAARANITKPVQASAPAEPALQSGNSEASGWDKQVSIFRSIFTGAARSSTLQDRRWVRDFDLGVSGHDETAPAPNNQAAHATAVNYVHYYTRGISLGAGKVGVLTGRMPTTPKTRGGEPQMTRGEARYWSLTTYDPRYPDADGFCGAVINSLMDDEIITDADGRFTIVYGRTVDRPANATETNGVTWADCGPASQLGLTLRWMTIHPDWDTDTSPNEGRLSWRAAWSSRSYDPRAIDINDQHGLLGDYQPVIKYLSVAQFQNLASPIRSQDIPAPAVAQIQFSRLGAEVPQYDVVNQRADVVTGSAPGVTQRLRYRVANIGSGPVGFTLATQPYQLSNCTAQVVSAPAVGTHLASRDATALVLDVTPMSPGAWNVSVTVSTDQAEAVYRTLLISGTAGTAVPVPAAVRDDIAIDLIDTVDGSRANLPQFLTYTLSNGGTAPWSLGDVTTTATGNCTLRLVTRPPATIAPGSSATMAIEAIPQDADTWTGSVTIAGITGLHWTLRGVANSSVAGPASIAPSIVNQPVDRTLMVGQAATVSVVASGSLPLTYRWQRAAAGAAWSDIPGAAAAQYTTPALTAADDGSSLRVVVANGTTPDAVSNPARLTVNPASGTTTSGTTTSGTTTSGGTTATGGPTDETHSGGCGVGSGLAALLMVWSARLAFGRRRRLSETV